jgi:hypothetical protein
MASVGEYIYTTYAGNMPNNYKATPNFDFGGEDIFQATTRVRDGLFRISMTLRTLQLMRLYFCDHSLFFKYKKLRRMWRSLLFSVMLISHVWDSTRTDT